MKATAQSFPIEMAKTEKPANSRSLPELLPRSPAAIPHSSFPCGEKVSGIIGGISPLNLIFNNLVGSVYDHIGRNAWFGC
jgi:hypothetical protein